MIMGTVSLSTICPRTCPIKSPAVSSFSVMNMGKVFSVGSELYFDFSRQFLCDCPDGLYYNHRDGACHWPDARECCVKEDGLAHRPCSSFAGCQEESPARPGYCDQTTDRPLYLNDDTTCTGYVKCDEFNVQFQCDCPDGLEWHKALIFLTMIIFT